MADTILVELPKGYYQDLLKILNLNEENSAGMVYDDKTFTLHNLNWWRDSGTTDDNRVILDLFPLLEALREGV